MTKDYKDEIEEILNKAGELNEANKPSKYSDSFYQKLNKILFSKEWKIAPGYIISLGVVFILTFIILRNIESISIEEQVVDILLSQAKSIERELTYEECVSGVN